MPRRNIKASLFLADPWRALSHLSVESISIQRGISGKKKSILYGPIGCCWIYLTEKLFNILAKASSCGQIFPLTAIVRAIFSRTARLLLGLFFFIRSLCIFAKLDASLRRPVAQWTWCLCLFKAACRALQNFKPSFSAILYRVSREKPHCLDNASTESPCSWFSSSTIFLNFKPKYASIISFVFMKQQLKCGLVYVKN